MQKVIVRFHPAVIQDMVRFLGEILGPGENLSKVLRPKDGSEIRQTVYRWDFPTAKMHLVGSSSNTNFATASLIAKQPEPDVAAEETASSWPQEVRPASGQGDTGAGESTLP